MDTGRSWSRDLGLGSARRLRCRPGATLRARFDRALRQKPQPDVCRLDPAVSWSCAYHTKLVDVLIASPGGRDHPPGGTQRGARPGGNVRRSVLRVPGAGSSVRLVVSVEHRSSDTLHANVAGCSYRLQVGP